MKVLGRGAIAMVWCLAFLLVSTASAQNEKVREALMSNSGAQGTEFFIVWPLNDGSAGASAPDMEIYIATSAQVANVEATFSGDNTRRRFQVQNNKITTMSTNKTGSLGLSGSYEINHSENEQVVQKALILTSDKPISVYVINAKRVSSDGYLALPTSVWGRRYIATSYYDFRELNNRNTWAGGFCFFAREDNTNVTVRLRGQGQGTARTVRGRNIGETFTVTLQRGECYMVMGDGSTRNSFDLTGSEITADRPIGFISFHARTAMPNSAALEGRDHLIEMTPPVTAWGKRYTSLEYSREQKNGQGRGDYYRIIATEDGTRVEGRFMEKISKRVVGNLNSGLLNAGQFQDFFYPGGTPSTLPYGVVQFAGNKPFFVMQYSTSANWDGDTQNDPFMINVTPEEQYLSGTIFQTPELDNYNIHLLNLVIKVLHPETAIDDLKSLMIDGKAVWNSNLTVDAPSLLSAENPIPADPRFGDNLYHVTVRFGEKGGTHIIESNGRIRFGGYIYGFGNFDSYGWPAAAAFRDVSTIDTMPPVIKSKVEDCGDWIYEVTEIRDDPDAFRDPLPRDSIQKETRFAIIRLEQTSRNYRLNLVTDPAGNFPRDPGYANYRFELEVIDKGQDAEAHIFMQDFADNITVDTVRYFADRLDISPRVMNFGKRGVGQSAQQSFTITNNSGADITLNDLTFKSGNNVGTGRYRIVSGDIPPAVVVPNNGTHTVVIEYLADQETTDPRTDFDLDTMIVKAGCSEFTMAMSGIAVMPRMTVADWDAGTRGLNDRVCLDNGLRITNPGTDTLVITAINSVSGSFTLSNPTNPPLPIRIPPAVFAPANVVLLRTACFERSTVGGENIEVTFTTNLPQYAPAITAEPDAVRDTVSAWSGRTQAPGPFIKGHAFGTIRQGSQRDFVAATPSATTDLVTYNTGTAPINLTAIRFTESQNEFWPAGSNDANYIFKIVSSTLNGTPITFPQVLTSDGNGNPVDVVAIRVLFRPNQGIPATISRAAIEATFANGVPTTSDFVSGEGVLPTFDANTIALTCNDTPEGSDVDRNLTITNNGTMPLTVSNITLANAGPEWSFVIAPTFPLTVQPGAPVNVPIRFVRPLTNAGAFAMQAQISHDAVPGNGVDETAPTPIVGQYDWTVAACSGPIPGVTNIDYGRQRAGVAGALCDVPEDTFIIRNTGGGQRPLEVRALEPVGADAAAFTIIAITTSANTPLPIDQPFFISANDQVTVRVRFTPTEERAYAASFRVRNYTQGENIELDPTLAAQVVGIGYRTRIRFDLTNDMAAGATRTPGEKVVNLVSTDCADYPGLNLTQATVVVRYDDANLAYTEGSARSLVNGWTITGPTFGPDPLDPTNASRASYTFTLTGTQPLSANAPLFSFEATLMLADKFSSAQTLDVTLPQACQIPITTGDSTAIFNCALTRRVVALSGTAFSLKAPYPNPAQHGRVVVDLGVGLSGPTAIDLVDVNGTVVRSLVKTSVESGEYTLEFPTVGLGSGVYFIRMASGPFNATQRVVIAD